MRKLVIGAVALALALALAGQAGAAQGAKKTVRRIHLITAVSKAAPDQHSPETPQGGVPIDGDLDRLAPAATAFRVHDLSRRWVEFQMAYSLATTAAQPTIPSDENPPSPFGNAQRSATAIDVVPSVAASLPIPLWMRGGNVSASSAGLYVPGCTLPTYRPSGFLRSEVEARRAGYYGIMSNIACEYGIPVGLFDAMILRESQYQPYIYSPKSAFGLTQLMPATAVALGVNRYDIEGNLRGGAKYLRQQLDRFGHYHLALAAYNAGPGRVRNGLVPRITETQEYVDNVLLNWSRLAGVSRTATVTSGTSIPRQRSIPRLGRVAAVSTF